MKIQFEIPTSPMSAGKTAFQAAVEDRVNGDQAIQSEALKASADFKAAAQKALETAAEGFAGMAVWSAISNSARYTYIKNFDYEGKRYDIEIDLLFHHINVEEQ